MGSSNHIFGGNRDFLFQIFKVIFSIQVGDISCGALHYKIFVVSIPGSIHGHVIEVPVRIISISLVGSSKGFFRVDKSIGSFFKMSDISIGSYRVSNEEDFGSP